MEKKILKKLLPLDVILQRYEHIDYLHGNFYFEEYRIGILNSMHQYFGKHIEIAEEDNELFEDDGTTIYNGYYFIPEWFEDDNILYVNKLFDDLFEEI